MPQLLMPSQSAYVCRRITLPLDGSEASLRTLVPADEYTSTELPRINPNYKVTLNICTLESICKSKASPRCGGNFLQICSVVLVKHDLVLKVFRLDLPKRLIVKRHPVKMAFRKLNL